MRVKESSVVPNDRQSVVIKYCERCAKRSLKLDFDDLSLRELCLECLNLLRHRRGFITRPAKPRR